jgi:hypothetical protein
MKVLSAALLLVFGGPALVFVMAMTWPPMQRAVFCSGWVVPYEPEAHYRISVPRTQSARVNAEIARLFEKNGLPTESESRLRRGGYTSFDTIACDGQVIAEAYSEYGDRFDVTFESNWLLGGTKARLTDSALLEAFRRRYPILEEESVSVWKALPQSPGPPIGITTTD